MLYFSIGCILLALIILIRMLLSLRSKNRKTHPTPFDNRKIIFYQRSYIQSTKTPFIRSYVRKIRRRLESIHAFDELAIRRETMKIAFRLLAVSILLVLLVAIIKPDLFTAIWLLFIIIVLNGIGMDKWVYRIEDQLMKQQTELITDTRHLYQQTNMVEQSIYDASKMSKHKIAKHGLRIYSILTSRDKITNLKNYYEVAPNRFLKLFAALSHMVMEYGDKVIGKVSLYLRSLSRLNKDINDEVIRRRKLNAKLRGFTVLALASVFFIYPLEWWARTYFPMTNSFYDSRAMIVMKVVVFAIAILTYLALRKIQEPMDTKYVAKPERKLWEKKLYQYKPVAWLVDLFTPQPYTSKRYRLDMLLKEANAPLTIEWLYVQKILLAITAFIFVIGLSLFLHHHSIQQTLHGLTIQNDGFFFVLTDHEKEEAQALTDFDRSIIQQVKGVRQNQEYYIRSLVTNEMQGSPETAVNITTQRILNKVISLEQSYLKWWEVLLAIGLSLVAYQIPIWMVKMQRLFRQKEMGLEVDQLSSVISILSEFDHMSVESILEWMERLSTIFKSPIQRCLLNFNRGPQKALEQLKKDVSFLPFTRLVDRLISALNKNRIQEAFDDLEVDQEYNKENRALEHEENIMKKSNLASLIAVVPIGAVFILILFTPLLYVSITELLSMITRFSP